jgi:hypothetical protein
MTTSGILYAATRSRVSVNIIFLNVSIFTHFALHLPAFAFDDSHRNIVVGGNIPL